MLDLPWYILLSPAAYDALLKNITDVIKIYIQRTPVQAHVQCTTYNSCRSGETGHERQVRWTVGPTVCMHDVRTVLHACLSSTVVRSYMTMNIRVRTCRRVACRLWPTRVKNFSYAPIVVRALLHERVYIRMGTSRFDYEPRAMLVAIDVVCRRVFVVPVPAYNAMQMHTLLACLGPRTHVVARS